MYAPTLTCDTPGTLGNNAGDDGKLNAGILGASQETQRRVSGPKHDATYCCKISFPFIQVFTWAMAPEREQKKIGLHIKYVKTTLLLLKIRETHLMQ